MTASLDVVMLGGGDRIFGRLGATFGFTFPVRRMTAASASGIAGGLWKAGMSFERAREVCVNLNMLEYFDAAPDTQRRINPLGRLSQASGAAIHTYLDGLLTELHHDTWADFRASSQPDSSSLRVVVSVLTVKHTSAERVRSEIAHGRFLHLVARGGGVKLHVLPDVTQQFGPDFPTGVADALVMSARNPLAFAPVCVDQPNGDVAVVFDGATSNTARFLAGKFPDNPTVLVRSTLPMGMIRGKSFTTS